MWTTRLARTPGSVAAVKVDKYVRGDVLESLARAMVALCLGDHGVSACGLPTGRTDRGVLDEQFVHLLEPAFVEVDAEPVHEVGDLRTRSSSCCRASVSAVDRVVAIGLSFESRVGSANVGDANDVRDGGWPTTIVGRSWVTPTNLATLPGMASAEPRADPPHQAPALVRTKPSWLLNQAAIPANRFVAATLASVNARRYHYVLLAALDEAGPASPGRPEPPHHHRSQRHGGHQSTSSRITGSSSELLTPLTGAATSSASPPPAGDNCTSSTASSTRSKIGCSRRCQPTNAGSSSTCSLESSTTAPRTDERPKSGDHPPLPRP